MINYKDKNNFERVIKLLININLHKHQKEITDEIDFNDIFKRLSFFISSVNTLLDIFIDEHGSCQV